MEQKGLSKVAIGELLGEPAQKYLDILEAVVLAINFNNMDLVEALRNFLSKFRLPGEAQKIDRIIETFSKGYVLENTGLDRKLKFVLKGTRNATQMYFRRQTRVILSLFRSLC